MRGYVVLSFGVVLGLSVACAGDDTAITADTQPALTSDHRAELGRLIEELGRADVSGVARIAATVKKIGPAALPLLTEAISDRDTSTEAQRRRDGLARVIGEFGPEAAPAVPALARLLHEPATRYEIHSVLMAMAHIGPAAKEAVPDLINIISRTRDSFGADVHERIAAIRAAGAIGPDAKDAVPSLIEAMTDKNEMVRLATVVSLGQVGPAAAKATPALVNAFKDTNRNISGNAVGAIAKIGPSAIPHLIPALDDKNAATKSYGLMALCEMGPGAAPAVPALIEMLRSAAAGRDVDQRDRTLHLLMQIGKPAFPSLAPLLEDKDENLRWCAVTILGRLNPRVGERILPSFADVGSALPEAASLILAAMRDQAVPVRQQAARAFGRIRPAPIDSMHSFSKGLKDEHSLVRMEVARTLGSFGPDAASTAGGLIEALGDKDESAREACYQALIKIGKGAVDALIDSMVAGNRDALGWDAGALAKIGKPSIGPLAKLLEHMNPAIRETAAATLGQIGPDAAVAAKELAAALKDQEPAVAYSAAEALAKIGPGAIEAAVALAEALTDRRRPPREPGSMAASALKAMGPAAAPTVPLLVKLIGYDDPEYEGSIDVRLRAIDVLAAVGAAARQAVPDLRRAMKQEDRAVRWHAATALGMIGPSAKAAAPDLVAVLQDPKDYLFVRKMAAQALGRIGPVNDDIVPALIKALRDQDLRYDAIWALGRIGPAAKDAVAPIQEIAEKEQDRWKREAAFSALKEITATYPTTAP